MSLKQLPTRHTQVSLQNIPLGRQRNYPITVEQSRKSEFHGKPFLMSQNARDRFIPFSLTKQHVSRAVSVAPRNACLLTTER
jgi:hypothetical protein